MVKKIKRVVKSTEEDREYWREQQAQFRSAQAKRRSGQGYARVEFWMSNIQLKKIDSVVSKSGRGKMPRTQVLELMVRYCLSKEHIDKFL